MIQKSRSKQNIAIVVLSLLLLLSIVFGSTYSYFNGTSKNLISGTITTATLSVELTGVDSNKEETTFILSTSPDKIVPGQPLNNTALQIKNTSVVSTYMVVVYALYIHDPENIEDTTPAPSDMVAMDVNEEVVGDGWKRYYYTCKDNSSIINTLIYLGDNGNGSGVFEASANGEAKTSLVLHADALKVPSTWSNNMQGKTVSLRFTAHIIQSDYLQEKYMDIKNTDVQVRIGAIATAIVSEFNLDKTTPVVD